MIAAVAGFGIYHLTSQGGAQEPVNVDFVLGGGTESTGSGDKLAVRGSFRGLAAAPDGTVYLFTQGKEEMVLWRRDSSGDTERIPIPGLSEEMAQQAAVAPDGSVYLAAGDLWKVSPAGKATKVIDTCKRPNPLATKLSTFCTHQVTGVTVTADGGVYIGDQVVLKRRGSYVHKISGNTVELVAGRPPKDGESMRHSNPAARHAIDPPPGTKAKSVLALDVGNSGWLASDERGLYWRTGSGIVHINHDGTLSPYVAARNPRKVSEPDSPFDSIGPARDAQIAPNATSMEPGGDLAFLAGRDEVYYSDAGKSYSPPFSREYDWGGSKTASQKTLMKDAVGGKAVYRVNDGELAPVIVGAQAVAASDDALYVAAEANDGDKSRPENWSTAVLRVQLPKAE